MARDLLVSSARTNAEAQELGIILTDGEPAALLEQLES